MKPLVIPVLRGDLINQVLQYVRECPGSTSNDMVKDLGAKKDSVYCSLASLRNRGLIATQAELVDGLKAWELSDGIPPMKDDRSYVPKQQTRHLLATGDLQEATYLVGGDGVILLEII